MFWRSNSTWFDVKSSARRLSPAYTPSAPLAVTMRIVPDQFSNVVGQVICCPHSEGSGKCGPPPVSPRKKVSCAHAAPADHNNDATTAVIRFMTASLQPLRPFNERDRPPKEPSRRKASLSDP